MLLQDVARHFRLSVHDGWRRCEILESSAGSYAAVDLFDCLQLLRACKAWIRMLDRRISGKNITRDSSHPAGLIEPSCKGWFTGSLIE